MIHIVEVIFVQGKGLHTFIGHQAQNQDGQNRDPRDKKEFFGDWKIYEKFIMRHRLLTENPLRSLQAITALRRDNASFCSRYRDGKIMPSLFGHY
jgi:hypothetical protein